MNLWPTGETGISRLKSGIAATATSLGAYAIHRPEADVPGLIRNNFRIVDAPEGWRTVQPEIVGNLFDEADSAGGYEIREFDFWRAPAMDLLGQ